jgi:tripartite-type tricarboxylate transporter receptor subunit TctC
MRVVFEPLGRQLGQALVIENRGGAGGTVGTAAVARAEPDGYTLLAHSSAHVTTPAREAAPGGRLGGVAPPGTRTASAAKP